MTFRDPQQAFEQAIEEGRLVDYDYSPLYAGWYMYMGHDGTGRAQFKHRTTRRYLEEA